MSDDAKAANALRYRPKELLTINETGFLLDNADGETFTLNATGIVVLRALIAGGDSRRVHLAVADKFDVDEDKARRDVDRFLAHLAEMGLVVADGD